MLQRFDYVIVGAGSSGCVLANRLSKDPGTTVCLIEAGPRDSSPLIHVPAGVIGMVPFKNRLNWAFETVPQAGLNGRRGYQPRGRTLGGSSSINAMIYIRGHASDYDDWAAAGNPGWGYADVLPYFKRSENQERGADAFHGAGGELNVADAPSPARPSFAFIESARAAGLPENPDFNGAEQEGAGLYQTNQRKGRRCSSAAAFLRPAEARPNLTILTGCQATRVLLESGVATGVEFDNRGRRESVTATREVILAAGAFGSPQILMLSGVGPADELRRHSIPILHELPGVGANLVDHIDLALLYRSRSSELFGLTPGAILRGAKGLWDLQRHGTGMLTTNYAEAGAFLRTDPRLSRPDIQLHFVNGIVDNHARTMHYTYGMSCHVCVLRPKSFGTLRLNSANPLDAPSIDPAFLAHDDDVATLLAGVKAARAIMEGDPLARYRDEELYTAAARSDDALVQAIRNRADTLYHPVSTCRMGVDEMAVVDPALRVRGIERLRVADAAVMPTLIGGNTHAPAVMIAEKAAELILAR
ncbi:MAG: FAD-dependent oxidoreductase [Gammaproteobacteria bacterium]|nr:FAD-dependent oxidoreductase [Gammaproteobacteria bacterium]